MMKRTPLLRSNKLLNRGTSTLKKTSLSRRKKSVEEIEEDKYESDKMNAFWLFVGDNTEPVSEISGKGLEKYQKITMHHILFKEAFPELKYALSNIMRVTWEEHDQIHLNSDWYPQVPIAIKKSIKDYNNLLQESEQWSDRYDQLHKQ